MCFGEKKNETPEIVSPAVNVRKSEVVVRLILKWNADYSKTVLVN